MQLPTRLQAKHIAIDGGCGPQILFVVKLKVTADEVYLTIG